MLGAALPIPALAAPACSLAGTDAYREQGIDAALEAFASARQLPECAGDGQLAFNFARTLHAVLDRDGDDSRVCLAADAYAEAGRAEALDVTVRAIATQGEQDLTARCLAMRRVAESLEQAAAADAAAASLAAPPIAAASESGRAGAWILTATSAATLVGAGVAYWTARDALTAADQARGRADHAAEEPIDAVAYQTARRDFAAAAETAREAEIAAWVLLGAGAALGTWAVLTWTDDADDAVVNLYFDGPAVRVEGRF